MKTIFKLGFISLVILFAACQKDFEAKTIGDITISTSDGWLTSPKWLAHEVERVADRYQTSPHTGRPPYPLVYSVEYAGQDYILIHDMYSSCWTCGTMYFTLSGELVEPMEPGNEQQFSALYQALESASRENLTLLWRAPL